MKKSISIFILILMFVPVSFAVTGSPGAGTKSVKSWPKEPVEKTLIVDVHEFKPMVVVEHLKELEEYKSRWGSAVQPVSLEGHDIDLWERIRKDLNLDKFNYYYLDSFSKVMPRLKGGADVSLGGITITAVREEDADFVPYMRSGAGVLVLKEIRWWVKIWLEIVFYALLPITLAPFFLGWAIYVCFSALIMWLLEKGNPDFNDKFGPGFPDARFFVHVVISSTGFGNQIPMSKWGRRVAVILMYSGIGFMFPLITGQITSEISKKNLMYISCKEDLKDKRVAVKDGTVTSKSVTLQNLGAELFPCESVDSGIMLLKDGKVDAVVHDKPALEYAAKDDHELTVVDELFDIQIYGIALKQGSPLREKISRLVLEYEESGFLDELSIKWLGSTSD